MKSFKVPKIVDLIGLKGLYSFMFKVWKQKYIKVSDRDESQIRVKVGIKNVLNPNFSKTKTKDKS